MPTFKAYKNGELIEEFSGAVPAKLTVSSYSHRESANSQALLDKVSAAAQ